MQVGFGRKCKFPQPQFKVCLTLVVYKSLQPSKVQRVLSGLSNRLVRVFVGDMLDNKAYAEDIRSLITSCTVKRTCKVCLGGIQSPSGS